MSYSTNPAIVNERMPDLLELKSGRACRWRRPGETAHQSKLFAYRIREALHIAAQNPDKFPELARAYEVFAIWYIEPGIIEARPKIPGTAAVGLTNPSFEPARPMASTVGLYMADEVIEAWRRSQPTMDPINFQATILDEIELTKLWQFFDSDRKQFNLTHPRWMILKGDGHITLTPWQEVIAQYSWKPTGAAPPEEQFTEI